MTMNYSEHVLSLGTLTEAQAAKICKQHGTTWELLKEELGLPSDVTSVSSDVLMSWLGY